MFPASDSTARSSSARSASPPAAKPSFRPLANRCAPRLEVITSTVFRKSVFRPWASVSTPSSITWRRMDQMSWWAFSSSSSSTTDQGFRRTRSVSWPPSSWPT